MVIKNAKQDDVQLKNLDVPCEHAKFSNLVGKLEQREKKEWQNAACKVPIHPFLRVEATWSVNS